MAVTALKTSLTGLPRRLVKDGIVDASAMEQAIDDAREDKTPLVAWLVAKNLADARDLAQAAAQEFGVQVLDREGVEIDVEAVRSV